MRPVVLVGRRVCAVEEAAHPATPGVASAAWQAFVVGVRERIVNYPRNWRVSSASFADTI